MLQTLWGHEGDLDALQMATRAVVVFGISLVLVRISGMRSFGRKSSFDSVVVIMLGAILSRAIYGASPFWPIVAASTALVVVHRAIAVMTARVRWAERAVKGSAVVLYRDGVMYGGAMHRAGISEADLDEAVRRQTRRYDRRGVHEIRLEASGEISVIESPTNVGRAAPPEAVRRS
jgi:uncharacterized membrane protein YcaP (DUF421 family)